MLEWFFIHIDIFQIYPILGFFFWKLFCNLGLDKYLLQQNVQKWSLRLTYAQLEHGRNSKSTSTLPEYSFHLYVYSMLKISELEIYGDTMIYCEQVFLLRKKYL